MQPLARALLLITLALLAQGPSASAQEGAPLSPDHQRWLASVEGLISPEERAYFVSLRQSFRRDTFIQEFWRVRDPDPATPINELRRRFDTLTSQNVLVGGDPRFLLYLLNGPPGRFNLPDGRPVARCFSRTRELEIWFYGGSERTRERFVVIFQKRTKSSPYEVWKPGGLLRPIQHTRLPTQDIRQLCAEDAFRYASFEIGRAPGYDRLLEEVLSPPQPSAEWLATLAAATADLPEGVETFDVETAIQYPGRRQSRAAMQVVLAIPTDQAPGREFDGQLFHSFSVVGEVIRDERLFETFRYRFEGPTPPGAARLPIGFTRYLRPGTITLRVLVEDLLGGRFAQIEREVVIPSVEGLPALTAAVVERERDAGPSLELLRPPGGVVTGAVRFDARARGEFDRVAFFLDDRQVLSKSSPPYSVELDLGDVPAAHRVRVVGFRDDQEIATDQIWLNQGAQRFRVRLIEPREGGIYPGSLTARAEVQTPDGQSPERVELFVNDQPVSTIKEPPYSRALTIRGSEVAVVRVVAYLADGSSAEDAVAVNTTDAVERLAVRLVEVPVLVSDASGEPVTGLGPESFRLLEDGVAQELARVEWSDELPLQVALLIDRSASMAPQLETVTGAATEFTRGALRSPEDRLALLSFADSMRVDAPLSAASTNAERALASLRANGQTALYDALAQALNYLSDVTGPSSLVLFSDGQDEISRIELEQVLSSARNSGVSIYAIGLEASFPTRADRRVLDQLTRETGGATLLAPSPDALAENYGRVLTELRSRYLLAYQSSSNKPEGELRTIRVEVERSGVEVRARPGYTP